MSNTMNTPPTIRWQLLSTASAIALLSSVYTAEAADADADRPLIWVELGGQMDSISGQGEVFAPAFLSVYSISSVLQKVMPTEAQRPPKFSFGEEGKISFEPEGSDWVFSGAIRYGRSGNAREVDHQTSDTFFDEYKYGVGYGNPRGIEKFADTQVHHKETNAILDFAAGKDVGLGIFGKDSSSTLNLGIRFAQFASKAAFDIRARPDLKFSDLSFPTSDTVLHLPYFHTYHATGQASRSFHGVGPSLSWSNSTPFAGNQQDGELTLDWDVNAALLFGKQRAHVRHQETGRYVNFGFVLNGQYYTAYRHPPTGHDTDRSVTVPNVGGSVGLSWRLQDFKVSMGYRADFFFGAMDTGIDAAKKSNATFNGPFASISIGLGD